MNESTNGSITVFLSLVLLLVLAVITTTIEAARVTVSQVYSERALSTAMDSVLAEYYRPLFDEYHIFGLDGGFTNETLQKEVLMNKLQSYMEYTFEPSENITFANTSIMVANHNLLGLKTRSIHIGNIKTLLDDDGKIFFNQAVSYMKNKEIGNYLDRFLIKTNEIKETKAAQEVLIEKQKVEENLFNMDQDIMKLMKLVDGLTINENGVNTDNNGKIIIQDQFVKQICHVSETKDNLGLSNDMVYQSLRGHFIQVSDLMDPVMADIEALITNAQLLEAAQNAYQQLIQIDQSKIIKKKELKQLKNQIKEVRKSVSNYSMKQNSLTDSLQYKLDNMNQLIGGTLQSIEKALPIVDELIQKQIIASTQISNYKSFLTEYKGSLNQDFYGSLLQDIAYMETYGKEESSAVSTLGKYNFQGMKNTLLTNKNLLNSIPKFVLQGTDCAYFNNLKRTLCSVKNLLLQYSYEYLYFDYNSLASPVESEGFFDHLNSLIKDGVMNMVIEDTSRISKKKITGDYLPSYLHGLGEDSKNANILDSLNNINLFNAVEAFTGIFSEPKKDLNVVSSILNRGEDLGETILFQEYLTQNFGYYQNNQTGDITKSMDYELEYVITGEDRDYDNLASIVMKLLLIRTIMNEITLMSDSKCNAQAQTLAAGFVGFTGLAALVSLVKTIIITIWAFEESLIDVAALLQGKVIPLIKSGTDIKLSVKDIFCINKALIRSKAEAIRREENKFDLEYKDYLQLFLIMKQKQTKSYRAMDLIQENLQNKYEDTFYFKNCIYGFQANAEFQIAAKFISLPFVRNLLEYSGDSFHFTSIQEYSY